MGVELACAGTPFCDLTFVGLDELPGPGQERFAQELRRSPGGAAITAIAGARLGLDTALAKPLGADPEGELVRAVLEAEGVRVAAAPSAGTPVTVVLPHRGERAMATWDPQTPVDPDVLAALEPEAVICGDGELDAAPESARVYLVMGDADAARHAGRPPASLARAHAVLVNAAEARTLAGTEDVEAAAHALAATGTTAVVTLGPDGALAVAGGELVRAPGVAVEAVDTTGAGDCFAAAWAWGEARGLDVEARLRWAVLYAALSVRVPTGAGGAPGLEETIEEGRRRGLAPPRGKELIA